MKGVRILADGGPNVGLGHIVRCSALLQEFERQGQDAELWVPERAAGADLEGILGHPVQLTEAIDEMGSDELARFSDKISPDAGVVIDSYKAFTESGEVPLSFPTAVIDDLANRPLPADLVVNGNLYGPRLEDTYRQLAPGATLLLGPRYTILRGPHRQLPPLRDHPKPPIDTLVSVGGADPQELLEPLVEALSESSSVEDIHAIHPSFSPGMDVPSVTMHRDLDAGEFRQLMESCHLALSAGGQTLHELARAGLPVVGVETGPDQSRNLAALERRGVGVFVGGAEDDGLVASAVETVEELANDPTRRRKMSDTAANLTDGRGVERVVTRILEEWNA